MEYVPDPFLSARHPRKLFNHLVLAYRVHPGDHGSSDACRGWPERRAILHRLSIYSLKSTGKIFSSPAALAAFPSRPQKCSRSFFTLRASDTGKGLRRVHMRFLAASHLARSINLLESPRSFASTYPRVALADLNSGLVRVLKSKELYFLIVLPRCWYRSLFFLADHAIERVQWIDSSIECQGGIKRKR